MAHVQTVLGPAGQDVAVLPAIARRTGLNIVAGSSVYLEPYSPRWALDAGVGRDAGAVRPRRDRGLRRHRGQGRHLRRAGDRLHEITAHEEKCLRAAARAHHVTGLSINTHTTHGTMALEQIEILREENVDPSRVVIGHMDINPDPDYLRAVLAHGVTLAFDTIGKQFWDFVLAPVPDDPPEGEFGKRAYYRPDQQRLEAIARLVEEGYAGQVVLSMDLTGGEAYLNPNTHGRLGYSYLGESALPRLTELGLATDVLDQLLVHNPRRLLTIG